ncbi:MAG: DNA (cytosine-5-)-methyltransferase [Verrucomicrobiae bacterium]|nr:DNA (cytosine-5-)-methyltransferase [Verrucomicrobiae bacterium]
MRDGDLFSLDTPPIKLTPPIIMGSLFSGIGTSEMAIKRITENVQFRFISEVDVHALKSHEAIHGAIENLGDITQIDSIPYVDILHASPPCQDLSKAGKRKGVGEGTRSGLMYEIPRVIKNSLSHPKVVIMEQVPDLIYGIFAHHWREMVLLMEQLGYTVYADVLNAKDYGIPQNRPRLFAVFISKDYSFMFPPRIQSTKTRNDYLQSENQVSKYAWLSQSILDWFMSEGTNRFPRRSRFMRNIFGDTKLANTISTRSDQTTSNYVLYGKPEEIEWSIEHKAMHQNIEIRRFTPRECWRLMGINDIDYHKAAIVNTKTHLYKQAGNAIVVDVYEAILREMIDMRGVI